MRIVDRSVYVGPSLYARFPVIRLELDLGALEAWPTGRLGHGFVDALASALPGLAQHGCSYREPGGFFRRMREDDGTCRILVSDTGIGIPPTERKNLFQRFYRASTATASGITGTGLGLAISKAIAESHGGTLELADEDGPGTVFVVELPLSLREEVLT